MMEPTTGKVRRLWWGVGPNRVHHWSAMPDLPLRWLRNPKRLVDEDLIDDTCHLLVQVRNRTHLEDPEAIAWLTGCLSACLDEIDARIAQGTLF